MVHVIYVYFPVYLLQNNIHAFTSISIRKCDVGDSWLMLHSPSECKQKWEDHIHAYCRLRFSTRKKENNKKTLLFSSIEYVMVAKLYLTKWVLSPLSEPNGRPRRWILMGSQKSEPIVAWRPGGTSPRWTMLTVAMCVRVRENGKVSHVNESRQWLTCTCQFSVVGNLRIRRHQQTTCQGYQVTGRKFRSSSWRDILPAFPFYSFYIRDLFL